MSVEFQYQSYVVSSKSVEIEKELSKLRDGGEDLFEVDWGVTGNNIDLMVVGSAGEIVEMWSEFFKTIKNYLSSSDEYLFWCYCDHDDVGIPVVAKVGGMEYAGDIAVKEYFSLKKEINETKFNEFTREISARLQGGTVKLAKVSDERLRDEYGLL